MEGCNCPSCVHERIHETGEPYSPPGGSGGILLLGSIFLIACVILVGLEHFGII